MYDNFDIACAKVITLASQEHARSARNGRSRGATVREQSWSMCGCPSPSKAQSDGTESIHL